MDRSTTYPTSEDAGTGPPTRIKRPWAGKPTGKSFLALSLAPELSVRVLLLLLPVFPLPTPPAVDGLDLGPEDAVAHEAHVAVRVVHVDEGEVRLLVRENLLRCSLLECFLSTDWTIERRDPLKGDFPTGVCIMLCESRRFKCTNQNHWFEWIMVLATLLHCLQVQQISSPRY